MGIWIRTQEKEIVIKVNNFVVDDKDGIICSLDGQHEFILGKYENRKRALEILDEIYYLICTAKITCYTMPFE